MSWNWTRPRLSGRAQLDSIHGTLVTALRFVTLPPLSWRRCLVKTESLCLFFVAATLLGCQEKIPKYQFTAYPPSVYMQEFHACFYSAPCEKTAEFRLDAIPRGGCTLVVTNGNGQGKNEVRDYEIFLNAERVIPKSGARGAYAAVKPTNRNILKTVVTGDPDAKIFILLAYDPNQK